MFCPNCGAQLIDGSVSCNYCGSSFHNQQGTPAPGYDNNNYGNPGYNQGYDQGYGAPPTPQYPMKWYKFLIYFALWAGMVLNALSALTYFTGSVYTGENGITMDDVQMLYNHFAGLKVLDMAYGLSLVAMAVLAFLARKNLKDYTEMGPKLLYALYACNGILPLVYNILACSITGIPFESVMGTVLGTLIAQAVILFCNYKYFTKREALFVN